MVAAQSPTDGAPTPDGGSSCTTLAVYSGTAPKPSPKQPSEQRRLLRTLRRTASIPQATVKLLAVRLLLSLLYMAALRKLSVAPSQPYPCVDAPCSKDEGCLAGRLAPFS